MGSAEAINEDQGVLQPQGAVADKLYVNNGVVRVEDLDWPNFDPERPVTMEEYLHDIGARMAEDPRESLVTDGPLHLYGRDFEKASVDELTRGLYFPPRLRGERPRKMVIDVTGRATLDQRKYPGVKREPERVAVSERIDRRIVGSAAHFIDRIAATTEGANLDNSNVEDRVNLGAESVFYGLSERQLILEALDRELLNQRHRLVAVKRSVNEGINDKKRIKNLEEFRLPATQAIQEMVRVSCRVKGYGTNDTQNTLNAVASNMHRSGKSLPGMVTMYTRLAIGYNDAVRGKINQSLNGITEELCHYVS